MLDNPKPKTMIRKLMISGLLVLTVTSCTKDFSTINVSPTSPATVPLDYLFGQATLQYAGSAGDPGYTQWRANLIYSMPMVQMMASLGQFYSGDKYLYQATNQASGAYFGTSDGEGNYPNAIKNLVQLIALAKADSVTNVNILSMARIVKVLVMHTMTDLYGDIPYFQAGDGYLTSNYTPNFDPQSAIYPDLINELTEAGAALNPSSYIPSASDFAYQGNLTYWKHLANSLILRLAMRLANVDPTDAQTWAAAAIAGGVFQSNAETYAIQYPGGPTYAINGVSYDLGPSDINAYRQIISSTDNLQWSNTFINTLQAREDPRLHEISTVYPIASQVGFTLGDTAGADQIGLPNGLDVVPGALTINNYSVPNTLTYASTAPLMIVTYAEVEFLKAEAEERGWVSGTPATDYALGQAAAIQQMASYNAAFTPTAGEIAAYQAQNPYPAGALGTNMAAKMNQIYTEMWILMAETYNGMEGWSDWRRTGYPALTPVNYAGNATGGTIPRRLIYPPEEITLDAQGYSTAVKHMGGDLFTTKIWWDGGNK